MTYAKIGRRDEALLPAVGITMIAWGVVVLFHAAWLPHALVGVD